MKRLALPRLHGEQRWVELGDTPQKGRGAAQGQSARTWEKGQGTYLGPGSTREARTAGRTHGTLEEGRRGMVNAVSG